MRCLIISDAPWATSGYGVQAKALAWTLKSLNHDVAVLAAYGLYGAAQQYDGVTVFPGGMDGFGNDVIGATYRAFNADVLITLKDLWVYRPQEWGDGIRWCPLVPVDHDPIPPGILQIMRGGGVFQPIAYSPFGLEQLENAGFATLYAPHCYDASVYYPMDKAEARASFGIPADQFAVGMVAVNRGGVPSRKAWPQNLEGFALFVRQYPQAHLYAHTYHGAEGHEQAANLPMICDQVGLRWDYADARQPGSHVTFPNQQAYKAGFPESYMRTFYNAMDVVNTISVGEGFGIPTLEAQACFPSGTLVMMQHGYLPIDDIEIGDIVLTHTGERHEVVDTMARSYTGDLYTIYPYGDQSGITCTADHPWYVLRDKERMFVAASDILSSDMLIMPREQEVDKQFVFRPSEYLVPVRNQFGATTTIHPRTQVIDDINLSEPLARLCGFYLSEGSVTSKGDVTFSFHTNEIDYFTFVHDYLKEIGLNPHIGRENNSTWVRVSSVALARMLEHQFGREAHNKNLPGWALQLPHPFALELLRGMWYGDGCFYIDREKYVKASYSTVSRSLAYGLRSLLLRFGIYASISTANNETAWQVRISGSDAEWLSELLDVPVFGGQTYRRSYGLVGDKYAYIPIRNIEVSNVTDMPVYNITVYRDASYVVNGYAVHNCGTPVLVGDWCSSADLLFSGAALPKEDAFRFYDGQGSFIFLPHPKAIGGAMATMLERSRNEAGVLRDRALNGAQRYEMRRVREDWRSVMKALEAKITSRHSGVLTIVRPEVFGVSTEQDAWAREVA